MKGFVVVMAAAMPGLCAAQTTSVWKDNLESATVWDNWSVDNGVWEIATPTTGAATLTDIGATLTGLRSDKPVKIYVFAASDAGQAEHSDTEDNLGALKLGHFSTNGH